MKATSNILRSFARRLYNNIWNSYTAFYSEEMRNRLTEEYRRIDFVIEKGAKFYSENILNAVYVTQLLLRDYFMTFYSFTFQEENFKLDVKFMLFNWLKQRKNVFIKMIDMLAIIAEAFLYCDRYKSFVMDFYSPAEWFVEWFQESLASEFFYCGGWRELEKTCDRWYKDLFNKLSSNFEVENCMEYRNIYYTEDLLQFLKPNPVKFPIPEGVILKICPKLAEKRLFRHIMYVRPQSEIAEYFSSLNSTKASVSKKSVDVAQATRIRENDCRTENFQFKKKPPLARKQKRTRKKPLKKQISQVSTESEDEITPVKVSLRNAVGTELNIVESNFQRKKTETKSEENIPREGFSKDHTSHAQLTTKLDENKDSATFERLTLKPESISIQGIKQNIKRNLLSYEVKTDHPVKRKSFNTHQSTDSESSPGTKVINKSTQKILSDLKPNLSTCDIPVRLKEPDLSNVSDSNIQVPKSNVIILNNNESVSRAPIRYLSAKNYAINKANPSIFQQNLHADINEEYFISKRFSCSFLDVLQNESNVKLNQYKGVMPTVAVNSNEQDVFETLFHDYHYFLFGAEDEEDEEVKTDKLKKAATSESNSKILEIKIEKLEMEAVEIKSKAGKASTMQEQETRNIESELEKAHDNAMEASKEKSPTFQQTETPKSEIKDGTMKAA